ncbi:MAG: lysophospholipid acyltransferase family protein [Anaerolineales bacterium]
MNRSIRSNQWVIHDGSITEKELHRKNQAVLNHAARCYYDYYHTLSDEEAVRELVPKTQEIETFLELSKKDQGVFVVAPHLSNFDLVVRALVMYGLETKILSYENPTGAYHIQNEIRASTGLDITPFRDGEAFTETTQYLKAGGMAATGVDRPVQIRKQKHMLEFFGRPSALPVGHITIALAANVPISVVAVNMSADGTYKFLHTGPLPLQRHPNRIEEIILNAEMVNEVMERYIRQAPEQWLMYYPVWPQLLDAKP